MSCALDERAIHLVRERLWITHCVKKENDTVAVIRHQAGDSEDILLIKKRWAAVLATALTLAGLGVAAPAVHASEIAAGVPAFGTITQLKVVNKSSYGGYVDKTRRIAHCNVQTNGLGCSINRTASATRTVQLSLGISRGAVASQLGFSSATSVSVAVTCSAASLKKGQTLVAYSVGSRHKYKVNKKVARSGVVLSNQTSNWLYAFNPHPAGISCRVV